MCPIDNCKFEMFWSKQITPICSKHLEELLLSCEICKKQQDDDGRCGCTNKDAYGL